MKRDNPVLRDGVYTMSECMRCGEMFLPSKIHICCKRNSYPKGGVKVTKQGRRIVDSDILLNVIDEHCDNNNQISFETIYDIVMSIPQHNSRKLKSRRGGDGQAD